MTLIEILVVLLIAGLVASIALPRLDRVVEVTRVRGEREQILEALSSLPYEAYVQGQEIHLAGQAPGIDLPEGWALEVEPPMTYRLNGLCTGGRLSLVRPDGGREIYEVAPPVCKPRLIGSGN